MIKTVENPYKSIFPPSQIRITEEDIQRISDAIEFMKQFDPLEVSQLEAEMITMHLAGMVNESNEFVDNYNVEKHRRARFIEHMDYMLDSDIAAWCRKMYEFSFWRYSNFVIVNIIWNWLNRSLVAPMSFL